MPKLNFGKPLIIKIFNGFLYYFRLKSSQAPPIRYFEILSLWELVLSVFGGLIVMCMYELIAIYVGGDGKSMTDEEISKKLRQKNTGIFDYIMENYNKLLWVVVGNILEKAGSSEDIEDCISDVYIKLLNNPKIYDHRKGSFKSFLVRIGKNIAIDRYRKLTRSNVTIIDEYSGEYDNEELLRSMLTKESREKILEALDNLKEPDREIIIRRYFYNEKVKVISEKMSLQPKVIENKLYQGKLKLKTFLINEEVFL